jgi:vesicle coat complex subunit
MEATVHYKCANSIVVLCFFRLVNLVEYIQRPLVAGLDDRSSYVRKTAVIGCVKMHHLAPAVVRGKL